MLQHAAQYHTGPWLATVEISYQTTRLPGCVSHVAHGIALAT